jgi:spore germination protein GerM
VRRWPAVLALLAALSGCGLPSDARPEVLDSGSVPADLLTTERASPPSPAQGQATTVFLVRDDRLVSRPRRATSDNVAADAVRALLLGPLPSDTAAGLSTAVPTDTRLISLDLSGSIASVDLSTEFGSVGGSQQVLAVAQIVYTLTASPSISGVRFAIEGRTVEVPNGSGSLSTAPRGRGDYRLQADGTGPA